jgi:hypothetical protein
MKRKVKRFDEGGYAALLADAQAADREREGLPSMDDSTSSDKAFSGSEAIQDESGIVSKLRRNTETGDTYNPEENLPASKAVQRKPVKQAIDKSVVNVASKPIDDSSNSKELRNRSLKPTDDSYDRIEKIRSMYPNSTARKLSNYESGERELKRAYSSKPSSLKSQNARELNRAYKEGGSVSSASKRADGIAQRGKTRGKVC